MNIKKEIKIGIFVLVVLASFIWGLNYLKGKNIFSQTNEFYLVYENVEGLSLSNNVTLNGLKVGLINDIFLSKGHLGDITVVISVNNDIKIPLNSIAQIYSADIMGTKAIKLLFTNSHEYHHDGDTLETQTELGLMSRLEPMQIKLENLLFSVDSLLLITHDILNPETRQNIQGSIRNVEEVTMALNKNMARVDKIFMNVESISKNLESNNEKFTEIFQNISSISDSLAKSELKATIENTNQALFETANILQKINEGEGNIGMLLNNDTLYYNLENASRNLDLLLEDLRVNPRRYLHFSVFGGKN